MQRQSGNRGRARARAAIPLLVLAAAGIGSGLALGSDRDARDLTVTGPGGSTTIVTTPPFSTTVPGPSIASTLIAAPSTVVVGAPITLTIGVEDANVATPSVTEYVKGLDQNFTVQSATSTQGACTTSGAQLECPLTNLAPGGQVGATVVAVPTTVGTFQLSAVATPYGPASPSVSVTVLAATADLGVSLPTSTLGPRVGHTVRIGVTVANVGPLAATGAVLRIAVPPETRLLAAVATVGQLQRHPPGLPARQPRRRRTRPRRRDAPRDETGNGSPRRDRERPGRRPRADEQRELGDDRGAETARREGSGRAPQPGACLSRGVIVPRWP